MRKATFTHLLELLKSDLISTALSVSRPMPCSYMISSLPQSKVKTGCVSCVWHNAPHPK